MMVSVPLARALMPLLLLSAWAHPVLDPVAVGHVRQVEVSGGSSLEVRTLSMDPPVFLVPGLLSAAEADELIGEGKKQSLKKSLAGDRNLDPDQRALRKGGKAAMKVLAGFDRNRDGSLDHAEAAEVGKEVYQMVDYDHAAFAAHVLHEPPSQALAVAKVPISKGGLINNVGAFFENMAKVEPHRFDRYSQQSWLEYTTPTRRKLRARTQVVTGLPAALINRSEPIQLVHYPRLGHYSCHHDSSPDSIDAGSIRLATLGIFLNDVPRGGELAFPGADRNDSAGWGMHEWSMLEQRCQPSRQWTALGGLVVRPKQGDAVFWYNLAPRVVAKLGSGKRMPPGEKALLWNSMHCGAPVEEGEKWFANVWLPHDSRGGSQTEL